MGRLSIQNASGDTAVLWDEKVDEEIDIAERMFNRAIKEDKMMAFRVDSPTEGAVIRKFDPAAQEIVVTTPLAGG